ncbi:MAG: HIT domain-containing protein [Desulfobacterota bacterium]|nr:HIT domain-containing protein [Thermodesulfobacteriota bacterium]
MVETLWAPWRMEYILSKKNEQCIFCIGDDLAQDKEKLILYRSSFSFVIMNRYPSNNGHLMIAPYQHISRLEDLDSPIALDMFWLLQNANRILQQCMKPEGFNIGINIGKVGGAGIEDHLHIHVVPRWSGDTNFMPVLGNVRVMPEYLLKTYEKLFPYFLNLKKPFF